MLIYVDGFGHYGTDETLLLEEPLIADATACTLRTDNPRTGLYQLRVGATQNNSGPRVLLGAEFDTVGVGYAYWIPTLPSTSDDFALVQFKDTDNNNLSTLTVDTTGRLQYRLGEKDGTILGSSAGPVVTTDSYQHFECEMFADDAAGTMEVRIDGVTVLNLTGLDNIPDGLGAPAQVRIGCDGTAKTGAPSYVDIDDFFLRNDQGSYNTDFIGDKKAYLDFSTQDGAETDWTPVTGSEAWDMLDEVPPDDDNSYITAAGNQSGGERTTVGVTDFSAEIVEIAGLFIHTRLWKSDAGTATCLVGVISNATEDQGSAHNVSTGKQWFNDVFEEDPDTSSPWTLSALNASYRSLERPE